MKGIGRSQGRLFVFLATVGLSALLMVWLLWRFPVGTTITAFGILAAFGISARLARLADGDSLSLDVHNQRV